MPLHLIGAGLPRTGTSSLREALRYLLNAPIYHMSEAFAHPEHAATWVNAIEVAGYEQRLSEVRAQIEPDRLVEWRPGDDWELICNALSLSVPERPFPHENSTASYVAHKEERSRKDAARVASLAAAGNEAQD